MADEPKKIDLEQTPAHPPSSYEDVEETRTSRREHPDSRRLRIAQEESKLRIEERVRLSKLRREEEVDHVREKYLKPITYVFLLGLVVYFIVVLARPKSPAPLQEVAKSGIALIVGGLVGFLLGKADKPDQ